MDTDTYPPIAYLNDVSHDVIRVVHEYNEQKGEVVAAYTFDAGPNAVIYTTEAQVPELLATLMALFPPPAGRGAEFTNDEEVLEAALARAAEGAAALPALESCAEVTPSPPPARFRRPALKILPRRGKTSDNDRAVLARFRRRCRARTRSRWCCTRGRARAPSGSAPRARRSPSSTSPLGCRPHGRRISRLGRSGTRWRGSDLAHAQHRHFLPPSAPPGCLW